ncbi:PEP-CTERM sorting domain-containing protein [bacterium]|nr:PEP-CTERM sorting domain-containing protein [bacterium]
MPDGFFHFNIRTKSEFMVTNDWCLITRLIALAVFAFAGTGADANALEVLFDNLAQSSNGYSGVENTVWPAQAFTTTSTGHTLSEVSVSLWNNSGTTGGFQIEIWDATGAGGIPGAQVGDAIYSGLAEDLSSSSGNSLTVSGLNVTLTANITYYVVVRGTSLTGIPEPPFGEIPGGLAWDSSGTDTTAKYITSDSGSSWIGPFNNSNQYMSVVAVPEPSTLAFACLGGLTLIWAGRKPGVKAAA